MSDFYNSFSFEKQAADVVLPVSYTADGRHIVFSIHADVSTSATIKVMGSAQQTAPDFTDSASADNDWGYIATRDLATNSVAAGATGVSITTTTIHKIFEIESNVLQHIAFELTGVSGDGIVIKGVVKGD